MLLAAAAALAFVGSAQAATVVNVNGIDNSLPVLITDFEGGGLPPGYSFSGAPDIRAGSSADAALPPGAGSFLAVVGGASISLSTPVLLSSFSFYMGSPDTFNSITFEGLGGYTETFSGAALAGLPAVLPNGDQSVGRTIFYNFGSDRVNKITFASAKNSFEVDNFRAAVSAIPEPATWAMMITGFGLLGATMRRRRKLGLATA